MKKILLFTLSSFLSIIVILFTVPEPVDAVPFEPVMCFGFNYGVNGGPIRSSNPTNNIIQVYLGDSIHIESIFGNINSQTDHVDKITYQLDNQQIGWTPGNSSFDFTADKLGAFPLNAEVAGYRFIYLGYSYNPDGSILTGRGPGGQRYISEDFLAFCNAQLVVSEKPTPNPSQITIKNATTGGSFSGSGTQIDPYIVPNRTNTRFTVSLLTGESITSWMVNGTKVARTLPQFDYTLWRTGDWIFGAEIKQSDGSVREESVYLRSH